MTAVQTLPACGQHTPQIRHRGHALPQVTWCNAEKGSDFVYQGGGGPGVFVHCSAAGSAGFGLLKEGRQVRFGVTQDPQSAVCTADVMSSFWASVPPG